MGSLSESAWQRGLADSRKWRGFHSVQLAGFILAAAAAVIAHRLEGQTAFSAVVGVSAAAALWALLILAAVFTAPIRQRNEAREELSALRAAREGRRAKLTEFLRQGRKLYAERPKDVQEWRPRVKAWIVATSAFLREIYGDHEAEMFLNPAPPIAMDISGSVSPEHNNRRLGLNAHIDVLRRILTTYPD